ncbi:unnamed protein product [Amoebophrya sp. A120]|nr:unnamed protein product [Amoebophrya sp. A120]|eukprot:GSA120T00007198001.1
MNYSSANAARGAGGHASAAVNRTRQLFRSGDPMNKRDAENVWASLKAAIHQIHQHNASTLSFEELYRNAYNLVLHKHGELLYNGVEEVIRDHLQETSGNVTNATNENLLETIKLQWDDHKTTMVMIRDILMYMDRNYVTQQKKVPVYDVGLVQFRHQITHHEKVKDRLQKIMLDWIKAERNGETIDKLLLRHMVYMLVELGGSGGIMALLPNQNNMNRNINNNNNFSQPSSANSSTASLTGMGGNSSGGATGGMMNAGGGGGAPGNSSFFGGGTTTSNGNYNSNQLSFGTGGSSGGSSSSTAPWQSIQNSYNGAQIFVYRESFEEPFLQASQEFYQAESNKYISQNTCQDYLKKAEARILEEKHRVHSYLHDSTLDRIQHLMDQEWILRHYETLVNNGAKQMFLEDKVDDLKRMHDLFQRCPECLKPLHNVLRECIKEAGFAVLNNSNSSGKMKNKAAAGASGSAAEQPDLQDGSAGDNLQNQAAGSTSSATGTAGTETNKSSTKDQPVQFIEALLQLRNKYSVFVRESFGNSKEFSLSMKTSFEECLNVDTKTAQYLSLFVDDLIKKGAKSSSMTTADVDIETRLDQVVTIFRYLSDKDIFESYYKQYFAKRLLAGKNADDTEKLMISKLKGECGHQYTAKLEGMLNDMKASDELTKSFHQQHPITNLNNVEMRLSVLTSGYWPVPAPGPCEIPKSLKITIDTFEQFYAQKHQGRRLTWNFNYGQADVRARMPKGSKPYTLLLSTYQMVLLYCFNEHETLSFSELLQQTKIPIEEMKRHLSSLYGNSKARILLKTSGGNPNDFDNHGGGTASGGGGRKDQGKEPQEGDTFCVNPDFESKFSRVRVPLIKEQIDHQQALLRGYEGEQHASDMPASVEEDRKHLTEAVIVRIMKSRRTLSHNNLIAEATKMLSSRFVPTPALIKQRIERLLEREYLERSTEDRAVYNYLA